MILCFKNNSLIYTLPMNRIGSGESMWYTMITIVPQTTARVLKCSSALARNSPKHCSASIQQWYLQASFRLPHTLSAACYPQYIPTLRTFPNVNRASGHDNLPPFRRHRESVTLWPPKTKLAGVGEGSRLLIAEE